MISSRTPEGDPNRCPVCRQRFRLSPSSPGNDAPCPRCGTLAWFATASAARQAGEPARTARRASGSPVEFTLGDFREQFEAIARMGMKDLACRFPGLCDLIPAGEDPEVAVGRVRGMVDAMTPAERADPGVIGRSRRHRIAAGAGVRPQQVEQFLRQFGQVRALMRQMASMSLWERLKTVVGIPGCRLTSARAWVGEVTPRW
jgi:hypothetical protein